MARPIIRLLLFLFNIRRSDLLRRLIKKVFANQKILYRFAGYKVFAGTKSAIESNILFQEYNEYDILEFIKETARSGYDFVDIGANIGLHSLAAALANPDAEIYAFEPEPSNFAAFCRNIQANGFLNIRPFKLGIADKQDNKVLNINQDWNKGKHSIKVNFNENGQKLLIPTITIDSLAGNLISDALLVKIDVEGFEQEVIHGAQKLLSGKKDIVVIIELLTALNGEATCMSISESLKSLGFSSAYKFREGTFRAVENFQGSADYIFVKGRPIMEEFLKTVK